MNIQEIKQQLPIGAYTAISKISGINSTTIQRFFNGGALKPQLELKIINATTELLKTTKEQKANALQELQAVASA